MAQGHESDLPSILTEETPTALNRAIGFVCWAAGIGLVSLAGFLWWVLISHLSPGHPGVFALLFVVCVFAALMLVAGNRLTSARPSKGTLFGPAVWFAIAGTALALAVAAVWMALVYGFDPVIGAGLASVLLLALFSYGAGTWTHRQRSRRRA